MDPETKNSLRIAGVREIRRYLCHVLATFPHVPPWRAHNTHTPIKLFPNTYLRKKPFYSIINIKQLIKAIERKKFPNWVTKEETRVCHPKICLFELLRWAECNKAAANMGKPSTFQLFCLKAGYEFPFLGGDYGLISPETAPEKSANKSISSASAPVFPSLSLSPLEG